MGIAGAAVPTNNVIDACYTRSGGTLRVIDPSVTQCKQNETPLAWNVQGPKLGQGPSTTPLTSRWSRRFTGWFATRNPSDSPTDRQAPWSAADGTR